MYVIKKLFGAVNEAYYRNYQNTILKPLPKKFTIKDVAEFLVVMHTMMLSGFHFSKDEHGLEALVNDLHLVMSGEEPQLSVIGKEASRLVTNMSYRVTDHFRNEGISATTREVMMILNEASDKSCFVGGCVRDMLLGKSPKDFDFVTDIDYDNLKSIFEGQGFTIKETGKNFLVLNVIKNGEEFEIANFRKDGTYEDGRRPESVSIGTIEDDAERRDLTVNALYFSIRKRIVIDPTGMGLDDIMNKTLRFVGNPKDRLQEDSLRAYRFYRFLGKGFYADPKSLRAVRTQFIEDNKKLKTLQELAEKAGVTVNLTDFERIRGEIEKMAGI